MITDMLGRTIDVGDIVLYTEPGAGRNLPPLVFGEVVGQTKATVKVHTLDKNFRRVQKEIYEEDHSQPPYHTSSNGKNYYRTRPTGIWHDAQPVAVKYYNDRFYIVKKI